MRQTLPPAQRVHPAEEAATTGRGAPIGLTVDGIATLVTIAAIAHFLLT